MPAYMGAKVTGRKVQGSER